MLSGNDEVNQVASGQKNVIIEFLSGLSYPLKHN